MKKLLGLAALMLLAALALSRYLSDPDKGRRPPAAPLSGLDPTEPAPSLARPREAEKRVIPEPLDSPQTSDGQGPGSLLVFVSWPDKTPAPDVFARIWPEAADDRSAMSARTDREGSFRLDPLLPGVFCVQLDRETTCERVEVRAGKEARLSMEVSNGPRVSGVVVDRRSSPVAGAHVWISAYDVTFLGAPMDDSIAAVTGSDGRFVIPSVGKARTIGALAKGYAPSDHKPLGRFRASHAEIELVLQDEGGDIQGVVVDVEGQPIERALIVGDVGLRFLTDDEGGMVVSSSLPLRTRSGSDGSFRFQCVQAGDVELQASSIDHCSATQTIHVATHETALVRLVLEPGGVITGRVMDPDGNPLGGVFLAASFNGNPKPPSIDRSWREQDWLTAVRASPGAFAVTRSLSNGGYRLTGLSKGWTFLVADNQDAGREFAVVHVDPGAESVQDIVVSSGVFLHCRIIDEAGRGIAGLQVLVRAVADAESGATYGSRGPFPSDEAGRITVPHCTDAQYTLSVRHPRGSVLEVLTESPIRAGPQENVIMVRYEEPPESFLEGVVLDDSGSPVANARISILLPNGSSDRVADSDETGEFHSKGFTPGTYHVRVGARGCPYAVFGPIQVRDGESLDLGVLQLKTPGFLVARVAREDGEPVAEGSVELDLRDAEGDPWVGNVAVELGKAVFDPLVPGDYTLGIKARGCVDVTLPVQIVAGGHKEMDVWLRNRE